MPTHAIIDYEPEHFFGNIWHCGLGLKYVNKYKKLKNSKFFLNINVLAKNISCPDVFKVIPVTSFKTKIVKTIDGHSVKLKNCTKPENLLKIWNCHLQFN